MKKEIIKIVIALILFLVALIVPLDSQLINNGLFVISYLIVGLEIVLKAIRNIFKGKVFDENFLMAIATIGAFVIGEYPEAVAVMLFYQIGEAFQDYAVDKSRKSIISLMDIRPDFANIQRNGKIDKINPEEVNVGDIIVVKPGEKVPLDGIIVKGTSMIDTSALTGESVPKEVKEQDEILSGCINENGVLEVEVTKKFGESTASKILDLVENASSKKSKSENFISKFAKYYTPIVVVTAVLLAIIPPMIFNGAEWIEWIHRALTFLVVSCPCALVISIPLGFFGGIGGASKIGVLVKGSNYLEALSNTEIMVLDKTGTLTEGVFEVQQINPIDISKEDLIKYATYAESFSNHPIAISLKKAYGKEIVNKKVSETQELPGLGVRAVIEGESIFVGNEKLMKENCIDYIKSEEIGTILYIAVNNKFAGTIVISDKIKTDAKETIDKLKKDNIKKIVMLTGDKRKVGENVAEKLGIDEVYTELLPSDKVEKVENLMKNKSENGKLAFIGDGINDAPVLAISDIGIAMGGLGSDAAIEAADVVLMTDEPSRVVDAIKISKKTMTIVKQNIIFAISIKLIVLILSAIGISNMWQAVFADVGVSILAILNALRALYIRR
jgi:cadmium-exporting ATPase